MKKNKKNGFTLIEIIIGVGIIILILAFFLTALSQVNTRMKIGKAKAATTQYAYLLETMKGELDYYPPDINDTLESLAYSTAPVGFEKKWRGPYLKEVPIDPWQTPYFYRLKAGTFLPRWIIYRNQPMPSNDSYLTFDAGEYGGWGGQLVVFNTQCSGTANRLWLNGVEIVHPDLFKKAIPEVWVDVTFLPSGTPNVIRVKLLGAPNSEIGIDIGSIRHPKTTYWVGSYGKDKQRGGTGFAKDLTWVTAQETPNF